MSRAAFLAALLLLLAAPAVSAKPTLSPTEHAFFVQINNVRVGHGLARVSLNDHLISAARSHSLDMVQRSYFEHGVFWRRLERFGITSGLVGENLGWDSHLRIAVPEVVELWLRSSEHRVVLLSPEYEDVGIGVAIGPFEGFPRALVVTVDFLGPLGV